jgi:two-component system, cell cycle response regulator DivK
MPHVLFVHANTDDRAMYADYFRSEGVVVTEAETTDAVLEQVGDHDAMVTGILVPGTFTATELIRRVRSAPQTGNMAVVVVTACTITKMQEEAQDAGCDALLLKPCLPETLLEAVSDALEKRRQIPPAQSENNIVTT